MPRWATVPLPIDRACPTRLVLCSHVRRQYGKTFDGVAGPLRSVASRTCDLLLAVTRVAELLHPGLDLSERCSRLLTRLEVGVPAAAVPLAAQAGTRLTRGDYLSLLRAGLCD